METPVLKRPWKKENTVVPENSDVLKCHLGDMLQQLQSVRASSPQSRGC